MHTEIIALFHFCPSRPCWQSNLLISQHSLSDCPAQYIVKRITRINKTVSTLQKNDSTRRSKFTLSHICICGLQKRVILIFSCTITFTSIFTSPDESKYNFVTGNFKGYCLLDLWYIYETVIPFKVCHKAQIIILTESVERSFLKPKVRRSSLIVVIPPIIYRSKLCN